jgi:hypothetical protein
MSRAPVQRPRPGKASRSFARRQQLERERASRRRLAQRRGRQPVDLRTLLKRVPTAAWICALVAFLNATAWSVITPLFQGRDEIDHYAYVETLAETGSLPHRNASGPYTYSPQEQTVSEALHYGEVRFAPQNQSIKTAAQQKALIAAVNGKLSLKDGEAGGASAEPPLFYALQTIPYALASGNMLAQLQLMRLFDALMGAITVLLVFFFLREVLPGVPWAATVGALCAALQPTFAFTTGSLNPDALLYVLCAATFLCLAVGFRRRLTNGAAVALGLVIAAGFLTYYSFIGVALGAFVGLAVLGWRDARTRGRAAWRAPALAFGIGVSPAALDLVAKTFSKSSAFGQASAVGGTVGLKSLFNVISYVWQVFLPRLPGMTHYFEGINTWREVWFDRSVGLYGWMDTMFPEWVDNVALFFAGAILLLCGRELVRRRAALRARWPELVTYAVITLAVLVMLGITSYDEDIVTHELAIGEPRYLLEMIPLLGAVITLAIRGAGRRFVPIAGAAMVILFLGHDVFSQLQVIARYYG